MQEDNVLVKWLVIIIDLGCTEYLTPEEGFLGYPWVLEKISIAPAPLRDLRSAGCQPLDSHSIPEMQASYQTVSSEAGNKGSRRVEPFPSGNLSESVTDLRFFIYKNMTVLHGGYLYVPPSVLRFWSLVFSSLIQGVTSPVTLSAYSDFPSHLHMPSDIPYFIESPISSMIRWTTILCNTKKDEILPIKYDTTLIMIRDVKMWGKSILRSLKCTARYLSA